MSRRTPHRADSSVPTGDASATPTYVPTEAAPPKLLRRNADGGAGKLFALLRVSSAPNRHRTSIPTTVIPKSRGMIRFAGTTTYAEMTWRTPAKVNIDRDGWKI